MFDDNEYNIDWNLLGIHSPDELRRALNEWQSQRQGRRKKPKSNHKADASKSQTIDQCGTPAYALDPLLPYIKPWWIIWESAAGKDRLITNVLLNHVTSVMSTDILHSDEQNFLTYEPKFLWDVVITNPPYSIKTQWINRCYTLGKPFALLVPVETIGISGVQHMMEQYGVELLLLNKRINFKMPNKGWDGSAQFPVLWYCWKMLDRPIVYGKITRRPNEQTVMEF